MKRADIVYGGHGGDYVITEPHLPEDFPEIVCVCGSTRFKDAYEAEMARLTNEGKIVLTVGRFGHQDGLDMDGELKKRLDELHLRKIDLSDRVHVVNPICQLHTACGKPCRQMSDSVAQGAIWRCDACKMHFYSSLNPGMLGSGSYVGESTRNEIAYAKSRGKKITYMNEPS